MSQPYAIEPPDMTPPEDIYGPDCPVCNREDCIVTSAKAGVHQGERWHVMHARCPSCGNCWEDSSL